MVDNDPPFRVLDEAAIAAAERHDVPYDWAYAGPAIDSRHRESVLADAPVIPDRGSYGVPQLKFGPNFAQLMDDLASPRFRRLVEAKLDIDLAPYPQVALMMGNTTGNYNEGYAHPDSRHKIVTVILGLSREWPHAAGRLRVLNSPDREDFAFEFPPTFGNMLMFKVSENSWHGFLPQKGQRMSLQLCWVDSDAYVRREYWRHGISAFAKSVPVLRKILNYAPK